jgi:tetratricopeptide (TPR) repeat protein
MANPQPGDPTASLPASHPHVDPAERYERGMALKKAGLYKAAIEQFDQAARIPAYALKAEAQKGICYKSAGLYEEAVRSFQRALKASPVSSKETVQILYALGRTLESLGRVEETLEAYRWIRREDPGYRDVAGRIEQLSTRRSEPVHVKSAAAERTRTGGIMKGWQDLLRITR